MNLIKWNYLKKDIKNLFHDEVKIHYIIGKALYYAGAIDLSMEV